jgi:hypothetical protein
LNLSLAASIRLIDLLLVEEQEGQG